MPVELAALILLALRMTAYLGPLDAERSAQAVAIARVVYADRPFFRADDDRTRTLALHVAVAHREGSGRTSAIGDGGTSFCAFQVHVSSGGTADLAGDAQRCAEAGHAMLRQSIKVCREHPIAWYAEGPRGCESDRAQRISADRMALAKRLERLDETHE